MPSYSESLSSSSLTVSAQFAVCAFTVPEREELSHQTESKIEQHGSHSPSLLAPPSVAAAESPLWLSEDPPGAAGAGMGLAQGAGFDKEITGAPLPLVLTVVDWVAVEGAAEEEEDAVAPHTLDAPLAPLPPGTKLTDTSLPLFSFSREGVLVGNGKEDKVIADLVTGLFFNCATYKEPLLTE